MRRAPLLAALVVCGLSLAPAASADRTGMAIQATLTGNGCGPLYPDDPCDATRGFAYWQFSGTQLIAPLLGHTSFHALTGQSFVCAHRAADLSCLDPIYTRSLNLTLESSDGTLVLTEDQLSAVPLENFGVVGTWTVDRQQSTGRFARYDGSGTYTIAYAVAGTDGQAYATFTIELSGTLIRPRA